jgi:dihydropteroate synthase
VQRAFRCGEKTFELGKRTYIMGVLNVTPDSFSDGGRFLESEVAVSHALRMVEDGADIIDIGGESTRPGAVPVSLKHERERVLPVIERLSKETHVPISIDTYKSEVAAEAIDRGASIVNDISGLRSSPDMASLVSERGVSLIIMHMKGEPRNMQTAPTYDDVVREIHGFLDDRSKVAINAGVPKDRIILDPGIGFGKTVEHNLEILAKVEELNTLGLPLMIGTSRKSFIGNILGTDVDDRLEGTIASNVAAVLGGVDFVRVHDVKEVARALALTDRIVRARKA